ncbi:MAG: helix-turn-helix domain-containing protein, partial [Chloroflexi bacterium]|nr:helix-turn-helix domain-containing protein [Chloroflexota bacterium]
MTSGSDAQIEAESEADGLESDSAARRDTAAGRAQPRTRPRAGLRPAHPADNPVDGGDAEILVDEDPTLSVVEAARLLGRDRTRVYALLRSGDLVAAGPDEDHGGPGPLRIDRSSVERWLVAGGEGGRPLSARNAWALIGLASGDQPFSAKCVGLLEHAEELSRARARLTREKLVHLAPRLRRRATLIVRQIPTELRVELEQDAALVRTGASAAAAYGWNELSHATKPTWLLDAYVSSEAFEGLQEQLNRMDIDADFVGDAADRDAVLLRVVDGGWPFPPHYPLAPQPLSALDLLDYPD